MKKIPFPCNFQALKFVYIDERTFISHQGGGTMDDKRIIELYFSRSEDAIKETDRKYGNYCFLIARNILSSREDAEECLNDTYLNVWNCIPPNRPDPLKTFLGKITRNISINRYIRNHAQKRTGETDILLEEVCEFIPDPASETPMSDEFALKQAINSFIASLPKKTRIIFHTKTCSCNSNENE